MGNLQNVNRFKLVSIFDNIVDIQNQMNDRKGIILNITNQYYSYILPKQINKSILNIETDYVPMSSFSDNDGNIVENWVNYDVKLVNMDLDVLGFMKLEIILTVGTGEGILGNSTGFVIREKAYWQDQEVVGFNSDGITISKSIYMSRPYSTNTIHVGSDSIATYAPGTLPLPLYSSKLLMKFYNPENL